jgi:chemotaxis protein MotB
VNKRFSLLLTAGFMTLAACGHSDEEMAGKQREIDKLNAEYRAAKAQMDQDQKKFGEAQTELERMRDQLKQAGMSIEKAGEDRARLSQALAEYKQRADQLTVIEARFRELRSKLESLNKLGLRVAVRNNRMVIQLPGDILFDSGKDALKPQGKDILAQVAEVIRTDKDLAKRQFQVAGHTDNAPYGGGPFNDNWGLSLARARQVLLFLVATNTPPKTPPAAGKKVDATGGNLDSKNWSAVGYGQMDPAVGTVETQSKDEKDKNRRVELVVQPNVEEMLNLNNIK